jgi:hypothetical protein
MARLAKAFSAAEVDQIIYLIHNRVGEYEFRKSLLVPDESEAALQGFKQIMAAKSDDQAGLFNEWMKTFISPAGRVRILDSLRQKKAQRARRYDYSKDQVQALMTPSASTAFGDMAAELGITKKEYFDKLARWMTRETGGKFAAQQFADFLKRH